MAKNNDQTASFMVRFSQKIYEDDKGDAQVQWRGKISHVQGGDKENFVEFSDAIQFIQTKLSELTKQATVDKTPEEQEGILTRSLDIWKKLSTTGAKMAIETIKDPRKGVAQIQEQISQVGEDIGQRLEIDEWLGAKKSDYNDLRDTLQQVTTQLASLHDKVDKLSKKRK